MIELKQTQDSDIDFIAERLKDKDESFVEQCGYGKRFFTNPVTADQIRNFQNSTHADSLFFTIFNDTQQIGSLELMINFAEKKCTVARFLIADEHRYKGYGTAALNKISEYIFNQMKMNRVALCVFDFNKSAMKCYEKAGFIEVSRDTRPNGWTAINMEKINKM